MRTRVIDRKSCAKWQVLVIRQHTFQRAGKEEVTFQGRMTISPFLETKGYTVDFRLDPEQGSLVCSGKQLLVRCSETWIDVWSEMSAGTSIANWPRRYCHTNPRYCKVLLSAKICPHLTLDHWLGSFVFRGWVSADLYFFMSRLGFRTLYGSARLSVEYELIRQRSGQQNWSRRLEIAGENLLISFWGWGDHR